MTFQALYYPFIHFRDETWVKRMSLYWEGVSRIVPHRERPTDDGDDVKGLEEVGCVTSISPGSDERRGAARLFSDVLQRDLDVLLARYSMDLKDTWPADDRPQRWSTGNEQLAFVHVDKMNARLLEFMVDVGLGSVDAEGRGSRLNRSDWIGMHPRLADVYMVCLTEQVATRIAAHPLTDDLRSHCAIATGSRPDATTLFDALVDASPTDRGPRDAEENLVAIAFEAVLPDMSDVPIETVIEVRRRTAEQRFQFQQGIETLAQGDDLQGADVDAVAREMELIYRRLVEPAMSEIERTASQHLIRCVRQLISMKTTIAGLGVAGAATVDDRLMIGAGALAIAVGVNDIAHSWRDDRRRSAQASPVAAYLTQLERSLPGGLRSKKLIV